MYPLPQPQEPFVGYLDWVMSFWERHPEYKGIDMAERSVVELQGLTSIYPEDADALLAIITHLTGETQEQEEDERPVYELNQKPATNAVKVIVIGMAIVASAIAIWSSTDSWGWAVFGTVIVTVALVTVMDIINRQSKYYPGE